MLEIFEGVIFCFSLYCAYVGCKEDYEYARNDDRNDARNDARNVARNNLVKNSKKEGDIYESHGDEPVSILPSYTDVCKM